MPTVLRKNGWRFFFYSLENGEPPHVHVRKGGAEAKVWLESLEFAYLRGYSARDRKFVLDTVKEHQTQLMQAWNDFFSN